jgi:hypothetical protein
MMLISQSQHARSRRVVASALLSSALLACAAILSGCSTGSLIADHMPTAAGGLPEGTPQRPATPAAYPAVNDRPPKRDSPMLTDEEQRKLEDDLVAAGKRASGATSGAAGAKPAGTARNP